MSVTRATSTEPALSLAQPEGGTRQSPTPAGRHERLCVVAAFLATLCLAVVPYLNSLGNDFTFDDPVVVRDNPMVTRGAPAELLSAVYALGAVYRPLTMLSYSVNYRVSPEPFGFHLVNVTLHALTSAAVLGLALALFHSRVAALAAGALFAVHPIHTEAVNNIVGRAELLAALLLLVALLALVRASRGARRLWLAVAVVAFAGALLAKESAFTGIGLAAAVAWWVDPQRSPGRALAGMVPFAAVGLLYLPLRVAVVGSLTWPYPPPFIDNPLAHAPALVRAGTALVVLSEYCSQLFVPLRLVADYSYDSIPLVTSPLDGRLLLAIFVFASLAVACAAVARRVPALLMAAAFTAIPLTLTANLLFPIGTIKAERLLYLPSVGWCLAAGWFTAAGWRRHRMATACVVLALTGAFAARTWLRNPDWQNNLALFAAAVQHAPQNAKAQYNLAIAYDAAGRLDDAMLHARQALRIYPDSADAMFVLGTIYERKRQDAAALYWYGRASESSWALAKAHLNIGSIRFRRAEYGAAEAAFRTGLAFEPTNARLLLGLSLALRLQGQLDESRLILAGIAADGASDAGVRDQIVAASLLDAERPAWRHSTIAESPPAPAVNAPTS
ncbi:MAG: tetratricopeptide repeat protein [Candidatus Binatia bacterium]